MNRHLRIFTILALCFTASGIAEETELKLESIRLSGFRIGYTYILGNTGQKELGEAAGDPNAFPGLTQFGWQFEWQYPAGVGGLAAVVEVVPLLGGMNLGLFVPSATTIIGLRSGSGYELGGGPMFSMGQHDGDPSLAMGFAVGAGFTRRIGSLSIPFNFVYVNGKTRGAPATSHRFTLVTGFAL